MNVWWLAGAWVVLSICLALGVTDWFKYLKAKPVLWTDWETSAFDHDIEIRWSNRGDMESRLRKPEVPADRRQARL